MDDISGHVSKFIWNETFVCRLVDFKYILFTELGESTKTIRLYNNQYSLTRALQSFLNTYSNLLDVEYCDNELWFLYDSYEIQRYNLCTMKWSGENQLLLYVFILFPTRPSQSSLPRHMHKGFLRLLNDRALVVYQDTTKHSYNAYLFHFPSFTFIQELPSPSPYNVVFHFPCSCLVTT